MIITWPAKDPDELLDYRIDWTRRLEGDVVANSSWSVSANSGLVVTSNSFSNTVSTVWLANGTPNKTHFVTNSIVTVGGRIFNQTVSLQVHEK